MLDPDLDGHSTDATPRQLREFAAIWLVSFGALAAWQWFVHTNGLATLVLAAIGVVAGGPGLIRPALIKPLFTLAIMMAMPIGLVLTMVLLGLLYFVLFTPVGWLFRLIRRDPLRLQKPASASYWSSVPQPRGAASYFRQSL